MTGLEKLIARAMTAKSNGNFVLAGQLEEIAAEIERDFHRAKSGCAWRNLAEYMNGLLDGKYGDCDTQGIYRRSDGMDTFQGWLDKWYIPKPVGGDGNPISFDKLYDCGCGAIENINVFRCNGKYEYVVTSHDNISFFDVKDLHEQVPDSIEKLREDMKSMYDEFYTESEYESAVDEWLARAEKLFGGDGE